MRKVGLVSLLLVGMFVLHGCGSGEITVDQQKAKKDALQKVADENPDPNREVRPQ
jgi:hypothetical protein